MIYNRIMAFVYVRRVHGYSGFWDEPIVFGWWL